MSEPTTPNDEISLAELVRDSVRFIQDTWQVLVAIPLLSVALVLGVGLVNPRYESQGLLRTPEFSLKDWRTLETLLKRSSQAERYLNQKSGASYPAHQLKTLTDSTLWEKGIQLRVAISDTDKTKFNLPEDQPKETLGLFISTLGSSPLDAQQSAELVSDYIKETQLWLSLRDWILSETLKVERAENEIERNILLANQQILNKEARVMEMRALIPKFPRESQRESALMFSTKDEGARYLPPTAQAIALETEIQDAREKIRFLNRQKEQLQWLREFFTPVRDLPDSVALGSSLAEQLRSRLMLSFPDPARLPNSGREIFYQIRMHLLLSEQQYLLKFDFTSPPSLSTTSVSGERALRTSLITLVLSLLITTIGLLIFRSIRTALR